MGTPKHFPCPYCGDDGSEVDELEWEVEELTEKLAKANERVNRLEDALLEQYNYGTLERRDIEALIPNIRKEQASE